MSKEALPRDRDEHEQPDDRPQQAKADGTAEFGADRGWKSRHHDGSLEVGEPSMAAGLSLVALATDRGYLFSIRGTAGLRSPASDSPEPIGRLGEV